MKLLADGNGPTITVEPTQHEQITTTQAVAISTESAEVKPAAVQFNLLFWIFLLFILILAIVNIFRKK